ncbi:protein asteroid homolog 1 [Oryzias melastigma]|uniref:Asteroid domain-containing protein n=1 Tax=Oryzias melastigma TaxID=30732 RepID=A0A3B3DMZ9_ORYME|nr:protein asteroid homolog 1 [Oryzias melastigma]XP_024152362.1 protein asteroid homolog 1 [Oryzias melastigma]
MGVQGLTTFVEGNSNFLQNLNFKNSRLVIDGCSLYFYLYFNHGLDQQHGGDYDAFACLLIRFLSALAACNIQAFVVLDGGTDPSDKKFATLRERMQGKIRDADHICHGRNGSVLPLLTRDVFIQVLIQRGIPLVQCPAEADWEIACLAYNWKCPVLTNDSDFYVFDLPAGYLPLRYFQWSNVGGKPSQRHISARHYTTNSLCRWFGGLNPELLPLCAVLSGNDYKAPKGIERLLSLINVHAGSSKGGSSSSRIKGLLIWLSSFPNVAEALEEVSRVMGEEAGGGKRGKEGGLSFQLWTAMQDYNIKSQSSLASWFSEGKAVFGGKTLSLAQLPEYLKLAATQGQLDPLAIDALVMRRVFLIPQVENSKLASSHSTSRAVRQAIYGLLLQKEQESATHRRSSGGRGRGGSGQAGTEQKCFSAASTESIVVEEYDRLEINLKKNQVEACITRNHAHLNKLCQAPEAARIRVLLDVLGVNDSVLAPVPARLQLAVAVTGFWLREAVPPPSQLVLQALVLGLVFGELSLNIQARAPQQRRAVPQHDCAAERNGMNRQRVRQGNRRGVDAGVAHSISQWQACLWSALCLNQVLLMPLPQPPLSWIFSGSLVHGLLRYLNGGRPAESLLTEGCFYRRLYTILLDAVRDCGIRANPRSSASSRRRRGRRGGHRGGRGARGGGRGAEEITNRFALLMSEEEEEEADGL